MSTNVHNPDQFMASLRQIIGQGRKRVGLLIGAGAPAGMLDSATNSPLIPAVAALTYSILESLNSEYGKTLSAIQADLTFPNIETILTRVRSLSEVVGTTRVHGLDSSGHAVLSEKICKLIGDIVSKTLPDGNNPYSELVAWISGSDRAYPVEVFTTNYDLLFEQALERARLPYFDGFTGTHEPFFDPATVGSNDLPVRWTRIWKLHGSLGWSLNSRGEITRDGKTNATQLIYPEHQKYNQTQKAPYSALFERLRAFLLTPDTLLISIGFSYADAHISARIEECLAANPSASVFAFQFSQLDNQACASDLASRRANLSVYAPDSAIINCISAPWSPGELPTNDWKSIRATYWGKPADASADEFLLGRIDKFARFFASSKTEQKMASSNQMMVPQ